MSLTICYVTARRQPKIEWFMESLAAQIALPCHVIVVDRFAETGNSVEAFEKAFREPLRIEREKGNDLSRWLTVVHPKPNVWSGPHRLTKHDWFSAASARNTAICLCKTSHIAFVDDLSVFLPHTRQPFEEGLIRSWMEAAWAACDGGYIACGAYKKVRNLVVKNGIPISYEQTETGTDNRLGLVTKDLSECNGEWLYGCSLVAHLEALLSVDGWPESLCDGMGFEDCLMGIVLANAGHHLKYDRRLLTLESDELHSVGPPMIRSDFGKSPADKSHRALEIARASKTFDNGFGPGGIRALRDRVLAGEPFSIQRNPQHEWFTGTPLGKL